MDMFEEKNEDKKRGWKMKKKDEKTPTRIEIIKA